MKKLFIVPNDDAEAICIQKLIVENNINEQYEMLVTGQGLGASWENIEADIQKMILSLNPDEYEIYGIELKGIPPSKEIQNINHYKYYYDEFQTIIGEKTSIEQIADILGVQLSNFDMMVAANDVGYIPKMIKLAEELEISQEATEVIIEQIDMLENIAKVPMQIGQPRTLVSQISNVEEIARKIKQENTVIAQKAIEQAYIYDDRFIWIDLEDLNCQREVTNILYRMGKYVDMSYNNVVISSRDKISNKKLVYFGNRDIINELNNSMQEFKNRWSGGEQESGFFSIQLGEEEEFLSTVDRIKYILEERILGYHRIVKPEDIIHSEETTRYGKNIRVHEISNPKTFYNAICASQNQNAYSAFVHIYDVDEYANDEWRMFLVNAGCAGCVVKPDGEIVSVFKNSDMAKRDDVAKISSALVLTAIDAGGNKMDCFDGFLTQNYMRFGFQPVCKVRFNDEFAPQGWNYDRDGRPDIIFFQHNGDSVEEILRRQEHDPYPISDIGKLPIIDDYDEAKCYRNTISEQKIMKENDSMKIEEGEVGYGEIH